MLFCISLSHPSLSLCEQSDKAISPLKMSVQVFGGLELFVDDHTNVAPWFQPRLSTSAVRSMLRGQADGAFVIRFCPELPAFALTYWWAKGMEFSAAAVCYLC